ncbi:MAG: DMT family transporter, partial [Pseudomonadota bacterium]
MNTRAAYIYAISAVLLWSTVATAFKVSLRYLDVPQLLFISSLTATLCLFAILCVQGKLRTIFEQSRAVYSRALLLGLLNPFAYYLILFKAYDLLPAQVAQPVNYTWAIMLMLLSVPLLSQRLNGMDILAALISYGGVVVICTVGPGLSGESLSILGIV